jgi:hypothetical protein
MARSSRPRARALALGSLVLASLPGGCFQDAPPVAPSGDATGTASSTGLDATISGTGGEADTTTADASTSSTTAPDPSTTVAQGDTSSTGLDSSSDSESSTAGPSTHIPCPAGVLDSGPLPASVVGDTALQDDELQGSCGGVSAPELAYTFTAPADGTYAFDTGGSDVDTVLYVLDGTCEGAELRCDDDGLVGTNASLTSLPLAAGQTVTVVVDGFSIAGGPITLSVREGSVECPAQSFSGPLPQTLLDQTVVATDAFESSCGTEDVGDRALAFTAPQDGIYSFDTSGSDFDTVLYVLDGTCGGPELACNDDEPGSFAGHSALTMPLSAGQAVTAVVEGLFGETGNVSLTVDRLPGTCPDTVLAPQPLPFVVMGSTTGADEANAGSCGGLGSPDHAYLWTAPADGVYRFDTLGSAFDTVVYLLGPPFDGGGCLGPELACNDDAGGPTGAASAYLEAGDAVAIVIDGANASGSFELQIEESTDSGDCCLVRPDPGCEYPPLETCVCTRDSFCCTDQWDAICVDLAVAVCGAICL